MTARGPPTGRIGALPGSHQIPNNERLAGCKTVYDKQCGLGARALRALPWTGGRRWARALRALALANGRRV